MVHSNIVDSNYSEQDFEITMKLSVIACLRLLLYRYTIIMIIHGITFAVPGFLDIRIFRC